MKQPRITTPPPGLAAEERRGKISRAIADWKRVLAVDAELYPWRGDGQVFWHEEHGYWAYFGRTPADTDLGWRYWNAFGTTPANFQRSVAVEINPPQAGPAQGTQGLIANARNGQRWVLHRGRLHTASDHADRNLLAAHSTIEPVPVRFSDGSDNPYFPVANLDAPLDQIHQQLAAFVGECQRIRLKVLLGREEGEAERHVQEAEERSVPEQRGKYIIPARKKTVADRVHADIWGALARTLTERGVRHTNSRVGRYGPDLRSTDKTRALFEIKTDASARSVYEALGQLLLYEALLERDYDKILVLPAPPQAALRVILEAKGLTLFYYRRKGRGYAFGDKEFDRRFGSPPA